jgi:hypothetical protein
VQLSDEERGFIAAKFEGCLCATCLLAMKAEHQRVQVSERHFSAPTSAIAGFKAMLLLWFLLQAVMPLHSQQRGFYGAGADTLIAFRKGAGQDFGQQPQYFPQNIFGLPDTTARDDVPSSNPRQICSLGLGGEITLGWKNAVLVNRAGPDFTVFENPFRKFDGSVFAEPAKIAVSLDGVRFVEFPFDSLSLKGCAGVTPTHGNESPFDPTKSGGNSFDLSAVGLDSVRFVRITDISAIVVNNPAHPFFDPTITGFDLDAVVGLNLAPLRRATSVYEAEITSRKVSFLHNGDGVTMMHNVPRDSFCAVYSLFGVEMLHCTIHDNQTILNLRHLPHGAYFLVLTTITERYVEKIFL